MSRQNQMENKQMCEPYTKCRGRIVKRNFFLLIKHTTQQSAQWAIVITHRPTLYVHPSAHPLFSC